jgi:hypothetical protein
MPQIIEYFYIEKAATPSSAYKKTFVVLSTPKEKPKKKFKKKPCGIHYNKPTIFHLRNSIPLAEAGLEYQSSDQTCAHGPTSLFLLHYYPLPGVGFAVRESMLSRISEVEESRSLRKGALNLGGKNWVVMLPDLNEISRNTC